MSCWASSTTRSAGKSRGLVFVVGCAGVHCACRAHWEDLSAKLGDSFTTLADPKFDEEMLRRARVVHDQLFPPGKARSFVYVCVAMCLIVI